VNEEFEEVQKAMEDNCVTIDFTGVEYSTADPFNVTVQPNPFSESTVISFSNPSRTEFVFELIGLNGELINSIATSGNEILINRQDLPAGIYMFRLTGSNNNQSGTLVIQ
jgi:hypothetical protein